MNNNEAVNNQQAQKKKSNVLWIVFVALIIIAMAVEGFILFNKGRADKDVSNMTNEELAGELAKNNPDVSEEEMLGLLNRGLSEEDAAALEKALEEANKGGLPPLESVDDIVEYTETGFIYKGPDGKLYELVEPDNGGKTEKDFEALNEKYNDVSAFLPDNNKGNETGNNNSSTGNGNSNYTPDDAEYIPDGSSGMSTNIGDYVDPSLIEGDGTGSTASGISQGLLDEWSNGGSNDGLPEPEYNIVG